ncbi:MAG: FtsX-like permease family protein, partial [Chloroflexota bacterium]
MSFLFRLLAMPRIALKRLWAQKWISLVTILGLGLAVALFMTIPLYSEGVNFRILEERLAAQTENRRRPPFTYFFTYIGTWDGPIEWSAAAEVDAYLMAEGSLRLNMPRQIAVRHIETEGYEIFPPEAVDVSYANEGERLSLLKFAATTDLFDHLELVEGELPAPLNGNPSVDNPVEVLIHRSLADTTGFQPGERYISFRTLDSGDTEMIPVEIAGIWKAENRNHPYWIYSPSAYEELMMVSNETFLERLAPMIEREIGLAAWYFVMDGSRVGPNEVNQTISALREVERRVQNALPDTRTFIDPTEALSSYRRDVSQLNRILFAFNLPIIGLVLTFIGLVGTLWADRLRNELAVLRSRGSTFGQLIGSVLIEALIIGLIAFVLGIVLSLLFSSWMGRVRSFLDFSAESRVRVQMSITALSIGLGAISVALVTQLLPTFQAAQQTIISYKLIQARAGRPSWWQRSYLDLLLLGISLYGTYLVRQQSDLIQIGSGPSDPFDNPLLFLMPALVIYALTLLLLRIMPTIMNLISRLLERSDSIALLQAARYLARSPRSYTTPFILLVLTVSFAIYTASLALTLDYHLYDQLFYRSGADINLYTPPQIDRFSFDPAPTDTLNNFVILPMSEYEGIEGVRSATRVGEYGFSTQIGSDSFSGIFYGIDREAFAESAYWRWDFSRYRLGSLMNGLGNQKEGVIIPRSLMRRSGIRVGEPIDLQIILSDQVVEYRGTVMGSFEQFPTWYQEEEDWLIVGNLDQVFELAGTTYPYRVWLDTEYVLDENRLRQDLAGLGLFGSSWREPHSSIATDLERPERQGLFGLLSVGFIASAGLTILGLGLYVFFSYQRRIVELGILRAVGLSAGHMVRLIAWELALLIVIGLTMGSLLGITVSALFIPTLQAGVNSIATIPAMVVEISYRAIGQVYLLFGLLFVLSFSTLALIALRMRVFLAVKLG